MPTAADRGELAEAFRAIDDRATTELDRAFTAFYPELARCNAAIARLKPA